jgi:protein-disulfide isomerase
MAGVAVLALGIGLAVSLRHAPLTVDLGTGDPALGRADAPVTLLEFTDYQCPYCRRFQAETWPALKREFVDTGKLRFVLKDLPMDFHAGAEPAAEAAHCASEQGRFWAMHDALLHSELSPAAVEQLAQEQGLDMGRFDACFRSGRFREAIERNAALAHSLGLDGTPSFVLGTVEHGELKGHAIQGALPAGEFEAEIRQALADR